MIHTRKPIRKKNNLAYRKIDNFSFALLSLSLPSIIEEHRYWHQVHWIVSRTKTHPQSWLIYSPSSIHYSFSLILVISHQYQKSSKAKQNGVDENFSKKKTHRKNEQFSVTTQATLTRTDLQLPITIKLPVATTITAFTLSSNSRNSSTPTIFNHSLPVTRTPKLTPMLKLTLHQAEATTFSNNLGQSAAVR